MNRLRVRYVARLEPMPGDGSGKEGQGRVEVLNEDGEVLGLLSAREVRFEHAASGRPVLHLELPVLGDHDVSVDTGP